MCFNEGQRACLNVMREMSFQIGKNCWLYATETEKRLIDAAEKRALACTLVGRRDKLIFGISADEALQLKNDVFMLLGNFSVVSNPQCYNICCYAITLTLQQFSTKLYF